MAEQVEDAAQVMDAHQAAHGHQLANCQNCGAALAGAYCHQCGQSGHVHRTLGHVFEEFAHGILHVDGKGWRTLPMLILNPGRLTREYSHGKRVRYIAPLPLYLFMTLLTFLVLGLASESALEVGMAPRTLTEARAAVAQAEADYRLGMADAKADELERSLLRASLDVARENVERLRRGEEAVSPIVNSSLSQVISDAARKDQLGVDLADATWNQRIKNALKNIDLVLYKIQQKAYKLSFLLVPMSLPVLWLLFAWKLNITLYDHTVFILYSLSFMLLLANAVFLVSLNETAIGGLLGALIVLAPPVHIFAQLKGAYQLSNFSAGWRTIVLLIASIVILGLYMSLMVVIGVVD